MSSLTSHRNMGPKERRLKYGCHATISAAILVTFGSVASPGRKFLSYDDLQNIVKNPDLHRIDFHSIDAIFSACMNYRLGVFEPVGVMLKLLVNGCFGMSPRASETVSEMRKRLISRGPPLAYSSRKVDLVPPRLDFLLMLT